MKTIYSYIITLLVGITPFFVSCEQEEIPQPNKNEGETNDEYFIHPEDTAGIVVPEGYRLVVFPGNKIRTRALDPVTSSDKVTHLQYLIYKETPKTADGTGTYKLCERKTLFNEPGTKNWPYKSVPVVLEDGENYKVVFLGNVDKSLFDKQTELLTGVENEAAYENARIHLPNREFTGQNMYYMGKAAFTNTPAPGNETDKIVYVPITLQRIVNRVDLCKEGIGNSYSSFSRDNFCDFLINNDLKPILEGSGGSLHQAITAQVDTLIMGLVYVATRNEPGHNGTTNFSTIADEMYDKYQKGENKYSVLKYRHSQFANGTYSLPEIWDAGLSQVSTYLQTYSGSSSLFDRYVEYADVSNNYANNVIINLAQYLYDTFHKGIDNTEENSNFTETGTFYKYWSNFIQQIQYQNFYDTSIQLNDKFKSELKKTLSSTYQNNKYFNPLAGSSGDHYKVTVNRMPSQIDFNMSIPSDGYLNNGNPVDLIYRFKYYRTTDYYLSIISLGTPADKLSVSSIQGVWGKIDWDGNITDAAGWTDKGETYTILSSSEVPITASQIPNIYRKGVHKITPVSLLDKQKKSSVAYPILHSLESSFISNTDDSFIKITETVNDNPVLQANKTYDLKIGIYPLCTNINNARVSNLLTIITAVAQKMYHRTWVDKLEAVKYPAWVFLPDISETNLTYTHRWVETDENYAEISSN